MDRSSEPLPRLGYGFDEVASMLGCSPGFLRLEWKRGKLKVAQLGRRRMIMSADLNDYLRRAGGDDV